MSITNLTNNIMHQPQNIVMNQVPMSNTIMQNVNVNNSIPITPSIGHTPQTLEHHHRPQTPMVETLSMAPTPSTNIVGVHQALQNQNITTMNHAPTKILHNTPGTESTTVLSKSRLQDLVRETDSTLNLEDEVEEIILNYVDEFVDRCLNGAALIAKNRHGSTIEVKDVQQFLNRNYSMWTPGFGTDELRPYKRSFTTEAHKHRLALIRKTIKKY